MNKKILLIFLIFLLIFLINRLYLQKQRVDYNQQFESMIFQRIESDINRCKKILDENVKRYDESEFENVKTLLVESQNLKSGIHLVRDGKLIRYAGDQILITPQEYMSIVDDIFQNPENTFIGATKDNLFNDVLLFVKKDNTKKSAMIYYFYLNNLLQPQTDKPSYQLILSRNYKYQFSIEGRRTLLSTQENIPLYYRENLLFVVVPNHEKSQSVYNGVVKRVSNLNRIIFLAFLLILFSIIIKLKLEYIFILYIALFLFTVNIKFIYIQPTLLLTMFSIITIYMTVKYALYKKKSVRIPSLILWSVLMILFLKFFPAIINKGSNYFPLNSKALILIFMNPDDFMIFFSLVALAVSLTAHIFFTYKPINLRDLKNRWELLFIFGLPIILVLIFNKIIFLILIFFLLVFLSLLIYHSPVKNYNRFIIVIILNVFAVSFLIYAGIRLCRQDFEKEYFKQVGDELKSQNEFLGNLKSCIQFGAEDEIIRNMIFSGYSDYISTIFYYKYLSHLDLTMNIKLYDIRGTLISNYDNGFFPQVYDKRIVPEGLLYQEEFTVRSKVSIKSREYDLYTVYYPLKHRGAILGYYIVEFVIPDMVYILAEKFSNHSKFTDDIVITEYAFKFRMHYSNPDIFIGYSNQDKQKREFFGRKYRIHFSDKYSVGFPLSNFLEDLYLFFFFNFVNIIFILIVGISIILFSSKVEYREQIRKYLNLFSIRIALVTFILLLGIILLLLFTGLHSMRTSLIQEKRELLLQEMEQFKNSILEQAIVSTNMIFSTRDLEDRPELVESFEILSVIDFDTAISGKKMIEKLFERTNFNHYFTSKKGEIYSTLLYPLREDGEIKVIYEIGILTNSFFDSIVSYKNINNMIYNGRDMYLTKTLDHLIMNRTGVRVPYEIERKLKVTKGNVFYDSQRDNILQLFTPFYNNLQEIIGYLSLSTPVFTEKDKREMDYLVIQLLGIIGITVILVFFISIILSRAFTKPLDILSGAMEKISSDNLDFSLRGDFASDINYIFTNFNRMINELRTGREKLRAHEKLITLQEIAKKLAHEIKNPLTPIKLNIQHLRRLKRERPRQFNEKFDEIYQSILLQIDTMISLADNFRIAGKIPDPKFEQFKFSKLADELKRIYHARSVQEKFKLNIELTKDYQVHADYTMLLRVLINLVENSIAAFEREGNLINIIIDSGKKILKISYKDNGAGMTQEVLDKIFDLSFSTKKAGMGIGMNIVKEIINLHSGKIKVKSEPGRGTEFIINIPIIK